MIRALVCALLCTVGTIGQATADDRRDKPSPYLKDVKIVHYQLSVEPPNTGRCAIDLNAWNTTIGFVANQSTKLKLMQEHDHQEQEEQLSDEARKASENFAHHLADDMRRTAKKESDEAGERLRQTAKKESDEADERWRKFLYAPFLLFSVQAMDMNIGCAGTVEAEVSAGLEPSKIIATGKTAYHPHTTIWSEHWLLTGPYDAFPHVVIQESEQIMKRLVNDWAKSQEEF